MRDPELGFPLTRDGRQAAAVGSLDQRVTRLESGVERVQLRNGPPTTANGNDPTRLREGTPVIDRTNLRLYFVVGDGNNPATNVWRYVALT